MAGILQEETRKHILKRISEQLARNDWKLPTEQALSQEVTASYGTVRNVMRALAQEGFVRKIPGSGTYILPDAARLLIENRRKHLLYLHSRSRDEKGEKSLYGTRMQQALEKVADARWRITSLEVGDHETFLEKFRRNADGCDGVIYLPPTIAFPLSVLGELVRTDTGKLVVVDSELGDVTLGNVATDNRYGGMLAARSLIDAGAKSLLVVITEPKLRQAEARIQGFRDFAEMVHCPVEVLDCQMRVNDDRFRIAYLRMSDRLQKKACPEGIFAISDAGAFGVHQALLDAKITPGESVSLIGFDGLPEGSKLNPSLATVVQPCEEIFAAALEMLEQKNLPRIYRKAVCPRLRRGESLSGSEKYDTITRKGIA
ncbi:MAG: substrate-binding domain-containing protein [Victivallaceae bacterium]|nr:substrate-binding domain-containing protein [Victivallaceae bacterium]